jgi:hypothetical protein
MSTEGAADPTPNPSHFDEDDPNLYQCNICRSDEGDDANPLVLCDKCLVCVHRECYANPLCRSYPLLVMILNRVACVIFLRNYRSDSHVQP